MVLDQSEVSVGDYVAFVHLGPSNEKLTSAQVPFSDPPGVQLSLLLATHPPHEAVADTLR